MRAMILKRFGRAARERLFAALGMTAVAFHLSPLTAQNPTHQIAFEALRDSLATSLDTTALRATLRTLRRSSPLHAGLVGLRLAELHAEPDFDEALSGF